VATRAVATASEDDKDHDQDDQDEGDDPKDLYPAWGGRGLRPFFGHVCLLCRRHRLAAVYETVCRDLNRGVVKVDVAYIGLVPKLWNATIEAHRREVRDAILDTAAALVARHGLRSVTMARIAEQTGIGRATLYKYFPGVEAILFAWHERQITGHLEYLAEVREQAGDARERLEAVLEAYALISHEHHGQHDTELAAFLHRDEQVAQAQRQLRNMIRDLLIEGAETGEVREDVPPDELATYCLHALSGASSLPSKAAVHRLVTVTLAGLRGRA
jgi:AcrR family transcriptional regulator